MEVEQTSRKHRAFHHESIVTGDSSGQAARVDRYRLNRMEHACDFSGSVEPLLGQLLALALPAHVISQFTIANELNAKLFSMIANGLVSVREVIRVTGSVVSAMAFNSSPSTAG